MRPERAATAIWDSGGGLRADGALRAGRRVPRWTSVDALLPLLAARHPLAPDGSVGSIVQWSGPQGRSCWTKVSLAVLLAVTAVILWGSQASANDSPITFEGTSDLKLTEHGPAELTILNNTAQRTVISLQAITADGRDASSIHVRPSDLELMPGHSKTVTITVQHGAQAWKTVEGISGYVVAVGRSGTQQGIARRRFTVAASTSSASPLATKWNTTSYRWKPWGDKTYNDVLPLQSPSSCEPNPLPEDGKHGGISSSSGGVASVTGECIPPSEAGISAAVRLSFVGLGHRQIGDYIGSLDFNDGEGGEVDLTVRRTDFFLAPLAALTLGVIAALLVGRWVSRLNTLSEREEEALLLFADAQEAETNFREQAAGSRGLRIAFNLISAIDSRNSATRSTDLGPATANLTRTTRTISKWWSNWKCSALLFVHGRRSRNVSQS